MINAEQAMPDGGVLSISTRATSVKRAPSRQEREVIEVVVADTGVGIPAETRDRIFDPFYTTKDTGTGLGLAIVHRIVEAHQGTISVRANGERGTAFVLELPVHQLAGIAKYEDA